MCRYIYISTQVLEEVMCDPASLSWTSWEGHVATWHAEDWGQQLGRGKAVLTWSTVMLLRKISDVNRKYLSGHR